MCLGMFMAVLDVQVVATSLPTIQEALGMNADAMSWIQTAYLTAEVVAIPLTGALTRRFGTRRLFVGAVTAFTMASVGCAWSGSFAELVTWRVLQGFFGGTLIPAVFAAVFLLFPFRNQGVATTLAGVLAVLAPTAGPIVGGWITDTYSWRWLFLVNVGPGILSAVGVFLFLPRASDRSRRAPPIDLASLTLMAVALAALEIALKEAPQRGWLSPVTVALGLVTTAAAIAFLVRSLGRPAPLVNLRAFADRDFTTGSLLSFACGVGLFASVYLMPVFLGLVRGYDALAIGEVMLVTGVAQLATAPFAVALERRVDSRLLALVGFIVFGVGCAMSATQSVKTGYDGMFWPQIVRGCASMFCLLAPTRLALGSVPPEKVADASGLFNVMRNLGGAIGLALVDTVIFSRVDGHAAQLVARLKAGDDTAALLVGLPLTVFHERLGQVLDAAAEDRLRTLIGRAALTMSMNEAWLLVAALTSTAVLALLLVRPRYRASQM